jgi:spermidine synthase
LAAERPKNLLQGTKRGKNVSTINKNILYLVSFFVNVRWAILAFFSGVSALIYQTLWVKQLSLVVGVDVYAVTTGVAAFFVGLALGSFWFGRISDRVAKPALLFAGLEGGIALLGPITTLFLSHSAPAASMQPTRQGLSGAFWQPFFFVFPLSVL